MKKLFALCALLLTLPAVAQDYYGLQEYGLRKNTTRVEFYGGMTIPQDSWNHGGQEVDLETMPSWETVINLLPPVETRITAPALLLLL